MVYVALFRGINVGGKSRVEMVRLKSVFESIECQDVSTYINSGNVIFSDGRSSNELNKLINKAVADNFGINLQIILRDLPSIKNLNDNIPTKWQNDKLQKTDVLFLTNEVDSSRILKNLVINPEIETVIYLPGAIVWNIGRDNVTRGGGVKLIKNSLYKQITARNINTVRRLYKIMSASSEAGEATK